MKYAGLTLLLIGVGLGLWGCGETTAASAAERTRHILLLSNTERADSLAHRIRAQLSEAPFPARLSDISRAGEPLDAIPARLPWALQQGVDICVLDLQSEAPAADSLRAVIESQMRAANPELRLVRPDSSGELLLFSTPQPGD